MRRSSNNANRSNNKITIVCTKGSGGREGGREREVGQTSINTTDNIKEIFRCTSDIYVTTVIQILLKLWSFEVAKRNGSHFEKTALKHFMSLCIFSVATGVQSQPEFLNFIMVIHWIR